MQMIATGPTGKRDQKANDESFCEDVHVLLELYPEGFLLVSGDRPIRLDRWQPIMLSPERMWDR